MFSERYILIMYQRKGKNNKSQLSKARPRAGRLAYTSFYNCTVFAENGSRAEQSKNKKAKEQENKMARLTSEMVTFGMENDVIRFIQSPHGDEPVAQIGDYWFYFASNFYDGDMTVEEYIQNTPRDEIVKEIIDATNGLSDTERDYYYAVLEEEMAKTTYYVPVVYSMYGRVEVRGNFKNPEEAVQWAADHKNDLPLPNDASYLEDSFEVDTEGTVFDKDWNPV